MFRLDRPGRPLQRLCGCSAAVAFLVCLLPAAAPAQLGLPKSPIAQPTAKAEHVKAELIADVDEIAAGKPFWVGVRYRIDPKWHIYWRNPGDSGQTTTVDFKLPPGFEASPVQWPLPIRFDQPGDIAGFGYEGEAVLLAKITPPAQLPEGPVELAATTRWLVCKDVCIPGRDELRLSIPAATSGGEPMPSANAKTLEAWQAKLPSSDAVKAKAAVTADGPTRFNVRVSVDGAAGAKAIEWFPPPSQAVTFEEPEVDSAKGEITVSASVLRGQTPPDGPLSALVVVTDASGQRRGADVPIVLPNAATAGR